MVAMVAMVAGIRRRAVGNRRRSRGSLVSYLREMAVLRVILRGHHWSILVASGRCNIAIFVVVIVATSEVVGALVFVGTAMLEDKELGLFHAG